MGSYGQDLVQKMFFNTIPGRFSYLREATARGNIWIVEDTVSFIERLVTKAGLSNDDQQEFLKEAYSLRIGGYATRIGCDMAFYQRYMSKDDPLRRYDHLKMINTNLESLISLNQGDILIHITDYDSKEDYGVVSAVELNSDIQRVRKSLRGTFETEMHEWLRKTKDYAENFRFPNVFFDMFMRYRLLNIGLREAQRYAIRLRKDITSEINEIKEIVAGQTKDMQ